jgi:tetratricopeptide (TPR) repeat protein
MANLMQTEHEFSAEEHCRKGLELLEAGDGEGSFDHLSRAYLRAPENAAYRSSYALALALVRGQFLGAVELARASVRQEFYNPDLYFNLSRIYLAFDFRAEAVRFLRRALMVDPQNQRVRRQLAELGIRRRPPIRSLPRSHVLNRWLGRVQARVLGPSTSWAVTHAQGA